MALESCAQVVYVGESFKRYRVYLWVTAVLFYEVCK